MRPLPGCGHIEEERGRPPGPTRQQSGTWALWTVCGRFPAVSSVFRRVAQLLSAVLGFLSGLLPVPAAEVLIAAIIILVLIRLIRILRQRDVRLLVDSLCQMIFGICAAVFLFVFLYGVHHTAPPLASQMGLGVGKYSVEQLEAFVAVCAEKAERGTGGEST